MTVLLLQNPGLLGVNFDSYFPEYVLSNYDLDFILLPIAQHRD